MRRLPKILLLALCSFAPVTGCGGASSDQKKADGKTDTKEEASPSYDGGIDLKGFAFGSYLVDAPDAFAKRQVSVEFGYLDIREQRAGDKEAITDYRYKEAVAFVQDGHLPTKIASGCVEAEELSATENPAKNVEFSGGAEGTESFVEGRAAIEGKDDETNVTALESLTAKVTGLGEDPIVIEVPELPTAGAIQLAGAIDANVTVNTFVRDINSTLEKSEDDLLIGDVGTGKNYNLIVVTFYPSEAANSPKPVRCFVAKDGSATLSRAKYTKMLPFRAVLGHFANVSVTTENDVTIWASAIAGQGAEELSVH